MGLSPPIELERPRRAILFLADQGGLQALFDEGLPHATDGGGADGDGLCDAAIGPVGAAGGVGLEQNAGMDQLLGSGLASGDQVVQLLAFAIGQGNDVHLLHGFLPKWRPLQENRCSCIPQLKSGRLLGTGRYS